jgi:hypothetical protein
MPEKSGKSSRAVEENVCDEEHVDSDSLSEGGDTAAIGFNFVAQSSLGQLNCGKSFLRPNILLKFI